MRHDIELNMMGGSFCKRCYNWSNMPDGLVGEKCNEIDKEPTNEEWVEDMQRSSMADINKHLDSEEWEKEFDKIQSSYKFTEYGHNTFCCGGDYCTGTKAHVDFIKSFITYLLISKRKEFIKLIEGIDDSGGGSGRRIKIQLLSFLKG